MKRGGIKQKLLIGLFLSFALVALFMPKQAAAEDRRFLIDTPLPSSLIGMGNIWNFTMDHIRSSELGQQLNINFCDSSALDDDGNHVPMDQFALTYENPDGDDAALYDGESFLNTATIYCGSTTNNIVIGCEGNYRYEFIQQGTNTTTGSVNYSSPKIRFACNVPTQEQIDNGEYVTIGAYSNKEAGYVYPPTISNEELEWVKEESNTETPDEIIGSDGTVVGGGETTPDDDGEDESPEDDSCESKSGVMGWLLCPGTDLVSDSINYLMGGIDKSLQWSVNSEVQTHMKNAWNGMLNIANIIFAIAFLIMIYSMATSTGLSNYDIKKMLPRLIVVAIAVNLSYYLCQALVDLTNIIGSSLYSFIVSFTQSSDYPGAVIANIMSSVANLITIILVLIFFGGTILLSAVVIVVCIVFRQIALTVLVIVSPIAIALYILPNTEKWARAWFNLFGRLLIVYPAFSLVWGCSKLLSNFYGLTTENDHGIPGFLMNICCSIIPAIAIIPLFKMSGNVMSFAAGAASGFATRAGIKKLGDNAVRHNPVSRKASSMAANRLNSFASKHVSSSNPIGRWAGRHALAAANKAYGNASSIDAETSALFATAKENAKNKIASKTPAEVGAIIAAGPLKTDQFTYAAALESGASNLTAGDLGTIMTNVAERADQLKQEGRTREAQDLLDATATAAETSGNFLGGSIALKDFKAGRWTRGSNNVKISASDSYNHAIVSRAQTISSESLSKMSASNLNYMQQVVSSSYAANPADTEAIGAINNLTTSASNVLNTPNFSARVGSNARTSLINMQDYGNEQFRNSLGNFSQIRKDFEQADAKIRKLENSGVDINNLNNPEVQKVLPAYNLSKDNFMQMLNDVSAKGTKFDIKTMSKADQEWVNSAANRIAERNARAQVKKQQSNNNNDNKQNNNNNNKQNNNFNNP